MNNMFINCISVFLCGGLGCILRYITGVLFKSFIFPFATFFVNIFGCFILGLLLTISAKNTQINPILKTALTVGLCGGLTTFSTFILEGLDMLVKSQYLLFFIYISLSLVLGFTAAGLGILIAKCI